MPQAPRMRSGRGGAGLELDLTDPRRPDALPPELRPRLPARGLVNYPEAAAVVQTLEEMVADADLLQAVQSWQRQSTRCQVVECGESTPSFQRSAVVVVSGFVAQVELIRLLIQRSPTLQNAPFGIQVELPRDLAHCECLVCLLSLTRSHSLRAVPFCDHPRDLLLALTRAARQLIVFGDPGTMQRRSQWFGALDHLDESTGPLEQALLGQLLAYVPEQEAMVRAGRTLESSSV